MADPQPQPQAPQEGVQHTRYGDGIATSYRLFKGAIVADQAAPTTPLAAIKPGRFPRAVWVVDMPAGVTGCTLVVGRVIQFINASGNRVTLIVEDEQFALSQLKRVVMQQTNGDPVFAYVTNIVGTVGSGLSIVYKLAGPGTETPE